MLWREFGVIRLRRPISVGAGADSVGAGVPKSMGSALLADGAFCRAARSLRYCVAGHDRVGPGVPDRTADIGHFTMRSS
jgi:hypothetical protein